MEMSEIIAQAQCLTKEALDVKNYILKTGKITSRLCNFAVFIVIVTPFFFVAKMYIIGAICCLSIIIILIIVSAIQKKWKLRLKTLGENVDAFKSNN